MCNSAFSRIVVSDTVILIYQLFAATVCGCRNGWFAFAPADNFYTAMIDCDKNSSFRRSSIILDILCQTCFDIKYQVRKTVFAKTVLTLYANYILRIAQRGMGKWELPHNENKCGNADLFSFALGRAHTPVRCISAPLLKQGISLARRMLPKILDFSLCKFTWKNLN